MRDVKVVVLGTLRFPSENVENVLPCLQEFVQAKRYGLIESVFVSCDTLGYLKSRN